jgi:hypothetical protein
MDDLTAPPLEELARRLWDERRVVTYLLYKLTVAKLMLAADDRRFVPDALREVDHAVELLRDGELRRDAVLRDVAEAWQVAPDELGLAELARLAPPPFDHTFSEHLAAFRELSSEVDAVAAANRALARSEAQRITGSIDALAGIDRNPPTTYDQHGQLGADAPVGGRLREAL